MCQSLTPVAFFEVAVTTFHEACFRQIRTLKPGSIFLVYLYLY